MTVAEVGYPEITVVRVHQGHESGRPVHVQPGFPKIGAARMLVIYDTANVSVRVVCKAFNAAKEVQNVAGDGIIKGNDGTREELGDE